MKTENFNQFIQSQIIILIIVCVSFMGCAIKSSWRPPVEANQPSVKVRETDMKAKKPDDLSQEEPSPRILASLQITEQGRMLIEQGKPDDAIRALERAINLSPNSGLNYFYLAEAWLLKGNLKQALEFNRMAGIYLNENTRWEKQVLDQKERIEAQYK